uniref:C-type lectin domain-containing protein n=1 Tax=Panagrolaimus davidi TaxID=227884 RepID=A0A914QPA0_9BILA
MFFLFQIFIFFLLCVSKFATSETQDCGEGWTYYPPTGFCYGVGIHSQLNTWTNAENYCQSFGGHLITVNSLAEYQQLMSYFHVLDYTNTWVGYYTPTETTYDPQKWIGVDGVETNFLKYGRLCNVFRWGIWVGPISGKRCLAIGNDQEKPCIFDLDCVSAKATVICKRSPNPSQQKEVLFESELSVSPQIHECGDGYSYFPQTGLCYGVNKGIQKSTWEAAEQNCQSLGGHLFTMNSLEEYRHWLSYAYILNLENTWSGYYTQSGTTFDASKWIGAGNETSFTKFGKFCNTFRWGIHVAPEGGKRCLAFGFDQEKPCFFDVGCNGIMKYICKRPPKTSEISLKSEIPVLSEYNCGDGWSYYSPTGFCYGMKALPQSYHSSTLPSYPATWTNAENYCQSAGGHLITINSLEEYQQIMSYAHVGLLDNTWVGYYTPDGTTFDATKWIGVDGKEVSILKYGKFCNTFRWGIHVAPEGGKRCLGIGYDQEKPCFFDVDCVKATMKVICKRSPEESEKTSGGLLLKAEVPTLSVSEMYDCGDGWSYFPPTGLCYGVNAGVQKSTWESSETQCQAIGGHLVTFNSLEEYRHFYSYVNAVYFANTWTGYYTPSGTTYDAKKWIGIDGIEANFLKYGRWCNLYRWTLWIYPSPGKKCLAMGFDQEKPCLFELDCGTANTYFVCKRPPKTKAIPKTTKATTQSPKNSEKIPTMAVIPRKSCHA